MKYSNLFKRSLLMAMVAAAATACQEDVNIGSVQSPDVTGTGEALLYVSDAQGSTGHSNLDFRSTASLDFYLHSTEASTAQENATFAYDATVLEQYNAANNTRFEAVPESFVTFSNGGQATLAAGEIKSAPVTLTVTSDGSLDSETTYAIPLRISSPGNMAEMSQTRIVFVKDLSALPDCNKDWTDADGQTHEAVKIFSCMEVNDTNPLNNLCYKLRSSGKYLIDALIIFSGNVNYNAETGRVYFFANPNVQHLLDNREKYLKPLQDRGIKVIMGLLGNHDRAGLDNLTDESAKLFAQEIKAICDAYQLDGVMYDDEYTNYMTPAPPGFVDQGRGPASRLAYEVWKLQPERWNVVYKLGSFTQLNEVDGVQPGTYIAYAVHDYERGTDMSSAYPGLPKSRMGLYSQEFNQGRFADNSDLQNIRENGYCTHMIFAMDPNRSNRTSQERALSRCASVFYYDELVIETPYYKKDW